MPKGCGASPRARNVHHTCLWCELPFIGRGQGIYCSVKCSQEHKSARAQTRTTKLCGKCGIEKPIDEFAVSVCRADGHQSVCKSCGLAYRRTTQRESDLQRRFGISIAEYDAMLEEQDYRCAICRQFETVVRSDTGNEIRMAIDHDHSCCPGADSCGECVRGLLCGNCNRGLGDFRDNTDYLQSAIQYLNKFTKHIETADALSVCSEIQ